MTKCKSLLIFCLFFSFPTFSEVAVVNNEKIEQRFVDFIKDEVEKQGIAKVSDAKASENVAHFPSPIMTPPNTHG